MLLDWVGQTLCTCYFWRFFSLNEINYTKGHQADAQSNPVDRSHVTCIQEWKSSWVSMVRHWITSAPLAASKTAFLVNFAWFSTSPLTLLVVSTAHMIVNYIVPLCTLCKADVRKTIITFLECAFMCTFVVCWIHWTVMAHGVHFMGGVFHATVLVRYIRVIIQSEITRRTLSFCFSQIIWFIMLSDIRDLPFPAWQFNSLMMWEQEEWNSIRVIWM